MRRQALCNHAECRSGGFCAGGEASGPEGADICAGRSSGPFGPGWNEAQARAYCIPEASFVRREPVPEATQGASRAVAEVKGR
jgi:hypothetical protein